MAKENTQQLRSMIAQVAARMIAEEGVSDFAYAKKKAGRQLGAGENSILPSNAEIEVELRLHNALFLSDQQPESLRELRNKALFTMQLLAKFNPYLTGAVLDGTAGLLAETHIHLFTDSSKDVEMFLLNQQIPFESDEKSYRVMQDAKRDKKGEYRKTVPRFTLETNSGLIHLSIFAVDDIRVANRRPADGNAAERLDINGLTALLKQT